VGGEGCGVESMNHTREGWRGAWVVRWDGTSYICERYGVKDLRLSVLDQSPVPEGSTPGQALANSIALARRVDELGYGAFWMSEHHAMDTLACTAPEIMLAQDWGGDEADSDRVGWDYAAALLSVEGGGGVSDASCALSGPSGSGDWAGSRGWAGGGAGAEAGQEDADAG
jgi:hypothetical protein